MKMIEVSLSVASLLICEAHFPWKKYGTPKSGYFHIKMVSFNFESYLRRGKADTKGEARGKRSSFSSHDEKFRRSSPLKSYGVGNGIYFEIIMGNFKLSAPTRVEEDSEYRETSKIPFHKYCWVTNGHSVKRWWSPCDYYAYAYWYSNHCRDVRE